jgi:cyclopropane-fatty-acyl-phospholipid synthase
MSIEPRQVPMVTAGPAREARPAAGMSRIKRRVLDLFESAGITVDGPEPWDPRVHHEGFYEQVWASANLGLGETYMDGWWDCDAVDELICRVLKAEVKKYLTDLWKAFLIPYSREVLFNLQTGEGIFKVADVHYNLGNELFRRTLDRRVTYSCAYWKDAATLDEAQENKLEMLCRKLQLRPGMRVLDVGCGWGAFAGFAAERHGVEVVGVTIAKKQVELCREALAGLPVEVRLQDFREVEGTFDAIVSVEAFEHFGPKNYQAYFDMVNRCLAPHGVMVLHTMGQNTTRPGSGDLWITRYIFPNSKLPSVAQIARASEKDFVIEDLHNLGPDYDRTYMVWNENFEAAWPELKKDYDDRFYRMFRYYLLSFAGGYRARRIQLWQLVFSRRGNPQPACRVV